MNISSRTPEGEFGRCSICGHDLRIEPTRPPGDGTCPCCGSLIWFPAHVEAVEQYRRPVPDDSELKPEVGEPIVLEQAALVLGRGCACDIKVNCKRASNLHCVLTFDEGYWSVRDLGSTNGTRVNGQKVKSTVLAPGDKIRVGRVVYTIDYTPSPRPQRESA